MRQGFLWRVVLPVALGVLLGLAAFVNGESGHVLATCVLEAADHEKNEGYFNCGRLSISVPPNGVPADVLREHLKADVEIIIRRRAPRVLSEVAR
jgi:hypothetical protein